MCDAIASLDGEVLSGALNFGYRFRNEKVPQEAVIGLTYAISCAVAVLRQGRLNMDVPISLAVIAALAIEVLYPLPRHHPAHQHCPQQRVHGIGQQAQVEDQGDERSNRSRCTNVWQVRHR